LCNILQGLADNKRLGIDDISPDSRVTRNYSKELLQNCRYGQSMEATKEMGHRQIDHIVLEQAETGRRIDLDA